MKTNFIFLTSLILAGITLMGVSGHTEDNPKLDKKPASHAGEKSKTGKKAIADSEFVGVMISRFAKPNANFEPPDPDFPDTVRVITDPKHVAKLAALFPGMDKGKVASSKFKDEHELYGITFLRPGFSHLASDKHLVVCIDKNCESWSRGDGYHKLSKPEEVRKLLDYYCDTYKVNDHFVKATVLHFYEAKGFERTHKKYVEKEVVIADRKQLEKLLSFLRNVGEGYEHLIRGGWVWGYIITLERKDAPPIEVGLKPSCNVWTEGMGDNNIAKPEEFKKFLGDLLKNAEEKPLRKLKRRD